MPIDYSKWKKIEVSDDEDDTHPNIDTPSLFRWRHQARLERMAEKQQKKEEIEKGKETSSSKMKELEEKLAMAGLSEKPKIEKEIQDLKDQEKKWRQKEKELEDAERLEPWNVDTIGHEAFSSSRINKIGEKKNEPKKLDEEEDSRRMNEFFEKNETLIQTYGRLKGGLKITEEFLLQHPHLASDYTASYLTIECLNLAIEGPSTQADLDVMTEQTIIMQYLLELAKSLHAVATNTTVIRAFFTKFGKADESYMKMFRDEVQAFRDRLFIRAREKREAAMAEYEAEQKQKRIEASPGGLDPQEVFESLPEEMRSCFESQDISRLHTVAANMDKEVFAHHFDRCIKSGLWVPGPQSENEETADESAVAEDEHVEAST